MTHTAESQLPLVRFHLFDVFGIELEYMIVAQDSLDVLPITDKVMYAVAGAYEPEVNRGEISWSNELALHVIELKTSQPVPSLKGVQRSFQEHIRQINDILKTANARLMPTAMHPWMDPMVEMQLWKHAYNPVYEAYNRIFDCRGHGWANLQSCHINIPFGDDREFAQLHAAIRFILPILPALAASSPFMDGKTTGVLDNRLDVYRNNAKVIPSITGWVIPEVCRSKKEYESEILEKMYRDIAPLDPDNILQEEWLNSRGAIARFDRNAIEIRVIDVQENPLVDIAIATAVEKVLRALVADKWVAVDKLNQMDTLSLHNIFLQCMRDGENALIANRSYLEALGYRGASKATAGQLWDHLINTLIHPGDVEKTILHALEVILKHGTLATRIQKAWNRKPTKEGLKDIYKHLCECLENGQMFI